MVGVWGYFQLITPEGALSALGSELYTSVGSYSLSVIPLFVFMGMILFHAKIAEDMYIVLDYFLRRIRGGLAMATIATSAAFGAVCGSVIAAASTISSIAVPSMKKLNYDDAYAANVAAAGSTLGIVIPPSTGLVLYGVLTEEPIGKLLLGGILPGLMLAGLLMITAYLLVLRNPDLAPRVDKGEKIPFPWKNAKYVWAMPLIFLLTMGGIYGGIFNPTEGGGIGAFLAFIVSLAAGRLTFKVLKISISESVKITAMAFMMLIGGNLFGAFLTISKVPLALTNTIKSLDVPPLVVLLILIFVYFILGCFMDEIATLVIMTPITYPLVIGLGYNGVWFGVFSIIMLLTGMLTPPVGIVSLIVSQVTKVPSGRMFKAQVPFWIALIVGAVLTAVFPEIAMFLPNRMS
jgi:tripartite ATP-independent transporter DctM subunit